MGMATEASARRWALAAVAAAASASMAHAQTIRLLPELDASLTLSNNAAYATVGQAQADAVLTLAPRMSIFSRGAQVQVDGNVGAEAVLYARGTQRSILRPRGGLNLRSQPVDRWLHFDASLSVDRVSADPYAAQPQSASSFNDYTSLRLRATPYLQRELTPSLSLLVRSDHVLTHRVGSTSAADPGGTEPSRDAHVQEQLFLLQQRPLPLGWALEMRRQDTTYVAEAAAVLRQTSARMSANYAIGEGFDIGVVAGHELSQYSLQDRSDNIVGLRALWRPTDRSELRANVERRFFGTGLDVELRHRTPWFSFSARFDRQPVAQAGTHLLGQAGGDVAAMLDGMLSTRVPDPAARQLAVQGLIRDYQLPTTLVRPLELYTSYAQLQQEASATAVFQGRLTTVSATLYLRRRERLVNVDDVLAPSALTSDNEQRGLELTASRRLSPLTTVTAAFRHTRIQGLAASSNRESTDTALSLGVSRALSPTSRLGLSLRHQRATSAVTSAASESALTAMLSHRF